MDKKVTKIIFEYSDGTVETLTDEAELWIAEVNNFIALTALRTSTGGMSQYNWKITKNKLCH